MKQDIGLIALHEKMNAERSISIAPIFERLSVMFKSHLLNQNEFSFAKDFLLAYEGESALLEYESKYLDAVPILRSAMCKGIIDEEAYHNSIYQVIRMEKDKFLAQLLNTGIISAKDYIRSDQSNLVEIIKYDDLPSFGSSTPVRTAIMLSEKYGFNLVSSNINKRSQEIILSRGNNRYVLCQKKGLFDTRRSIKDEIGREYTYSALLKKLKCDYGTV